MLGRKMHDVIVIGGGPAGLFAAYELVGKNKKILIIEKGKEAKKRICPMKETGKCISCVPCDIMCGVGGAGTFSDGILNLRPDVGGNLVNLTKEETLAWELVNYIDKTFLKFGAPKVLYGTNENKILELRKKCASVGINFIDIKQRHIGSDLAPFVIDRFTKYLVKKGVKFSTNTEVTDLIIKSNKCYGVRVKNKEIEAKNVIAAPGRVGVDWFEKIISKYKINAKYGPIDVGIRVEVPAIIMEHIIAINKDPKFHIRTTSYDDFVRTFCTNANGFVVKESYDSFVGVNGHSLKSAKSQNTNFAFLVRIELTEPVENTTEYGRSIAKLATTIGGGKPIIQRIGDLRRDRRSTWDRLRRNPLKNTLTDVTPGDISTALPHRVVTNLIEGLEKLNEVIPGVAADSTLLYAPEIKYYAMEVQVNERLETNIKNLFVAGDGAGLSRDIINASATGILAARGILE